MGNNETKIHDAWEGAATTMCGLAYGTKALEARAVTCATCLRVRGQWEHERAQWEDWDRQRTQKERALARLARAPKAKGKRRPRHAQ